MCVCVGGEGQGSAGLQDHRKNVAELAGGAVTESRQLGSHNDALATNETAVIVPSRHDNHLHSHIRVESRCCMGVGPHSCNQGLPATFGNVEGKDVAFRFRVEGCGFRRASQRQAKTWIRKPSPYTLEPSTLCPKTKSSTMPAQFLSLFPRKKRNRGWDDWDEQAFPGKQWILGAGVFAVKV